jgi:hypothetical protein
MPRGRKPTQLSEKILFKATYLVELTRGRSHIASTLSEETRHSAIAEIFEEFSRQHGADKLAVFRELLAESLERRDHPSAAQAVLKFALPGVADEDAEDANAERRRLRG